MSAPYVQTYRSRLARRLAVAVFVFSGVLLVGLALSGDLALLVFAGPLLLLAAVAWFAYWLPALIVDESGIEVRNIATTVRVPWSELVEIDGRYGLRVITDLGSWNAWACPAPFGLDRARGRESEAANAVRTRWERQRALGSGTGGEVHEVTVRKDPLPLVVMGALGALSVAGVLLL